MAEHERRAKGRALLNKAGYGSAGGHLSKHADSYATKHEISEGIHEHEGSLHKGSPKTRIKLKSGGLAAGGMPKMRGDRKPRHKGGKGHHTNVNVIVGGGGKQPIPVPVPVPAGGPGGGPPMSPPMPPDGGGMPPGMAAGPPPPGAGGPPMNRGGRPGYATGGNVQNSQRDKIKGLPEGHFKRGGKTKAETMHGFEAGAGGGLGRLEKAKEYGAKVKKGGRA